MKRLLFIDKNLFLRIKGFRILLIISPIISFPLIYNQIIKQNDINVSQEQIDQNLNTKAQKLEESETPTDHINHNDQSNISVQTQIQETKEQTNSLETNDQSDSEVSTQSEKTEKILNNLSQNENTQNKENAIQSRPDLSTQFNKENQIVENNCNTEQQKQRRDVQKGSKIEETQQKELFQQQGLQNYIQLMNNIKYISHFQCHLIRQSVENLNKHHDLCLLNIPEYKKQETQEQYSNQPEGSLPVDFLFTSQQKVDKNPQQQSQDDKKKQDIENNLKKMLEKPIDDYPKQQKPQILPDLPQQNQFSEIQFNSNQNEQFNSQDQQQDKDIQQINQDDNNEELIINQSQNIERLQSYIDLQNQNAQNETFQNNKQDEFEVDRENENSTKDQSLYPPQNNENGYHHRDDLNQVYSNILDIQFQEDLNQEVQTKIDNNKLDHQILDQPLVQLEIKINEAYQILDQKFYLPSFKKRQILDEILKKFVRDFQSVEQYQEEYNLDGTQEQLLQEQIQYFIPIRGDGNCLFTSIGFQYIYYNLVDAQRFQRLVNIIDSTEFKQNNDDNIVETEDEQQILRQELKIQLQALVTFKEDPQQLLQQIAQYINNDEGPYYGLLIIFLRNYFRKILQDFYDNNEMNFLIQNPDQINEIITWEYMYDETDIALKLFAAQEQILIRCFQKMNVDDKIVQISEYKDDDQNLFQYKIGLAFQPGHYNAMKLYE